jgi:hypothetical protein
MKPNTLITTPNSMTVYCRSKPVIFFKGLLAFIVLGLIFTSCKNDEKIGLELQDPAEGINTVSTDTFTLITTTVREDSLITGNLSFYHLGNMRDPLFGSTAAAVYTEPRIEKEGTGFSFPTSLKIDSVYLSIKYRDPEAYYGNLGTPQLIKVYQLNNRIYNNVDSQYFSNTVIPHGTQEIGSWSGIFGLNQKFGDEAPQLRIKLSSAFAQLIVAADQNNNELFINSIKGIAVVPSNPFQASGEGALIQLSLSQNAPETRITVYYNDSLTRNYPINDASATINNFFHSYEGSVVRGYKDNPVNSDTTFIQSLAGLKTKITMPHLFNLVKSDAVAINKAELIVSALDGTYNEPYDLPGRLLLVQPDNAGRNDFLTLASEQGSTFNSATKQYSFTVTRHIQNLINTFRKDNSTTINKGFYLIIPTDNPVSASRLVVDANKQSGRKIRLVLTYTIAK